MELRNYWLDIAFYTVSDKTSKDLTSIRSVRPLQSSGYLSDMIFFLLIFILESQDLLCVFSPHYYSLIV